MDIKNIIDHTFVINLEHRKDRWNRIQKNFNGTNLKLNRWNGVYGKKLDEKQIKEITTTFCNNFCSYGMIGCWLSHYSLWAHIVKNKLNNVLILEDDAIPVNNFNKKFGNIWENLSKSSDIPKNYDIIYIGCCGSCDNSSNNLLTFIGIHNKDIYVNRKKVDDVMIPGFPLGCHAYIISYKGAKKLVDNKEWDKVKYHIDTTLANFYNHNNSDPQKEPFNVYALKEPLVFQSGNTEGSDISGDQHPSLTYFFSKIKSTDNHKMDVAMNTQHLSNRKLGINVTGYTILFATLSFLVGLCGNQVVIQYYIFFLIILGAIDIYISTNKNINNLIFEVFIISICLYVGYKLNNNK